MYSLLAYGSDGYCSHTATLRLSSPSNFLSTPYCTCSSIIKRSWRLQTTLARATNWDFRDDYQASILDSSRQGKDQHHGYSIVSHETNTTNQKTQRLRSRASIAVYTSYRRITSNLARAPLRPFLGSRWLQPQNPDTAARRARKASDPRIEHHRAVDYPFPITAA